MLSAKDDQGQTSFILSVSSQIYQAGKNLLIDIQQLTNGDSTLRDAMIFPKGSSPDRSPLYVLCCNDICSFTWTGADHINQDIFDQPQLLHSNASREDLFGIPEQPDTLRSTTEQSISSFSPMELSPTHFGMPQTAHLKEETNTNITLQDDQSMSLEMDGKSDKKPDHSNLVNPSPSPSNNNQNLPLKESKIKQIVTKHSQFIGSSIKLLVENKRDEARNVEAFTQKLLNKSDGSSSNESDLSGESLTVTADELGDKLKLDPYVTDWLKKQPPNDDDPLLVLTYRNGFVNFGNFEQNKVLITNSLLSKGAQQVKGDVFHFSKWEILNDACSAMRFEIPWAFYSNYNPIIINGYQLGQEITIESTVIAFYSESKLQQIPYEFFRV